MEELKKFVNHNRLLVWCGLGALMFISVAFCSVVSVDGEELVSFNGFNVLYGAESSDFFYLFGLSRILMLLIILAPVCLIVANAVKIPALESLKKKLPLTLCTACFALALFYIITLGDASATCNGVELKGVAYKTGVGFGVYLYLVLGLAGAAVAYLTEKK